MGSRIQLLAMSADGRRQAFKDGNWIEIRSLPRESVIRIPETGQVDAAFTPDGTRLITLPSLEITWSRSKRGKGGGEYPVERYGHTLRIIDAATGKTSREIDLLQSAKPRSQETVRPNG